MNKIKLTDDQVNALYMAGHDGECLGDAYESMLNTAIELGIVRPAAADAASGERVVFTCNMNPVALEGWIVDEFSNRCGDVDVKLKPGEELVVRKVRGT